MIRVKGVIPGPLVEWEPQFVTDSSRVKLEEFPDTLYPEAHLDFIKNSKETWGDCLRGYPHIEDISLKATLNYGASGNCYFNAIATLLYGSQRYWHTVKAHHLEYVDRVLRDHKHPRHTLYTKINANLSKSSHDHGSGLNLWMRLCTPYAWQDGEILQVTADLYNVFIVQYTMSSANESKVEGVKVRGNYNSTHLIIRFVNGNHFQPLIPADEPLSEFCFPLITRENTKGKISVPQNTPGGATALNHPWRSPMSRQTVPEQLLPIQVFREMSTFHFSLISGFNTEDSTLNPEYLRLEYICAKNKLLQASPLADGTETVRTKIIRKIHPQDDPHKDLDFIPSNNHGITSSTHSSAKTEKRQKEAAEVAMTSTKVSFNSMPAPTTIPTALYPTNVPSVPSQSLTSELHSTKKRLIRFITRAELERQQAAKQQVYHF